MWFYVSFLLLVLAAALHFWWRRRYKAASEAWENKLLRALEEHQDELSTRMAEQQVLFNSMIEGVLLLGKDDRIQIANQAFHRQFEINAPIRGKSLIEIVRTHELGELLQDIRARGQVIGAELTLPGLKDRILQVNGSVVSDPSGREHGIIMVFHDLSRLKMLERTRQEFVGNVSHELRTPLSLIKGYVETLLDGAKEDPDLTTKFLGIMEKHVHRLTFLIDDLLTIAQLESGQISLQRSTVRLDQLAIRLAEEFTAQAREKRTLVRNEIIGETTVHADPQRLEQVLCNLIDNAIKYGRPEGHVTLAAKRVGELLEISVTDDGPGIPLDSQERIFERFYRLDKARSREQGGTGLGLSIVKHIVQSHGGKVWVDSEPGKGSSFHFTIPIS